MKKLLRNLFMLVAVIAISSCNSSKKSSEKTTKTTRSAAANGDVIEEAHEITRKVSISVEGTVKQINRGKDGYTALIADVNGKLYSATISIPNLKDPKQYRSVAIGEKINVTGETYSSDAQNYIVVRELKK